MEELKPCPFCGGEPKTSKFKIDDGYYCEMYCEGCNCGIISAGWSEPQEAEAEVIAKWNTRFEPVKRGKWVEDICCDEVIICNVCGNEAYFDFDEGTYIDFDYCPNCGAKMFTEVKQE